MGMPTVITQTGTGSAIWTPDWLQNPFSVGIAVVFSGATGTATVDATLDNINNGSASANWFTIVGPIAANATAHLQMPVQGLRVNMVTASETSVVAVNFVQATFGR